MQLRAVTVCVNYADMLRRSIERWQIGTDQLVVVTDSKDIATQELCQKYNIETHITNIFYANGATFNKGAALSEAFIKYRLRDGADWLLTFDADMVPPPHWRDELAGHTLTPGVLYGTHRYWVPEGGPLVVDRVRRMPQSWVLGFFCLFHATDPCLPSGPLFDLHWPHAGNYDTTFCRRWPKDRQELLTCLPLIHQGEERQNWMGRHNKPALQRVLKQRQGHEDWNRERMENPPEIK